MPTLLLATDLRAREQWVTWAHTTGDRDVRDRVSARNLGGVRVATSPNPLSDLPEWVPGNVPSMPVPQSGRRRSSLLRRVRRWWALRKRERGRAVLLVRLEPNPAIERCKSIAARPRSWEHRGRLLERSYELPGARSTNTEVVWDERSTKLVVGVWAEAPAGRAVTERQPQLAWYRAVWLPHADGARAIAHLHRGRLSVRMPLRAV